MQGGATLTKKNKVKLKGLRRRYVTERKTLSKEELACARLRAETTKNNGFIGQAHQCSVAHTQQVLLALNPAGALPYDKPPLTLSQQREDAEFEAILALYIPQQLQ
jgi:hypothetical protein